jgi:hypothetical protein
MEQNGYDNPRMDRLKRIMELLVAGHAKFGDEHNKLLTSQVRLTGSLQTLTADIQSLRESQKATDERLGILIKMRTTISENKASVSKAIFAIHPLNLAIRRSPLRLRDFLA